MRAIILESSYDHLDSLWGILTFVFGKASFLSMQAYMVTISKPDNNYEIDNNPTGPNTQEERVAYIIRGMALLLNSNPLGAAHKVRHARWERVREGMTVYDRGRGSKSM